MPIADSGSAVPTKWEEYLAAVQKNVCMGWRNSVNMEDYQSILSALPRMPLSSSALPFHRLSVTHLLVF